MLVATTKDDLLQGTLDMMILRVLSRGENHGWAIAQRIQGVSKKLLVVEEGSLYPALFRLERQGWLESEWGQSEKQRRAKFYRLTRSGRTQLDLLSESWDRKASAVALVMQNA
jgi:PadR family transcriptional regulator PadR